MAKLSAVFHATAIEVCCPHCGESLPAPCGSLYWTLGDINDAIEKTPERTCDACDGQLRIRQQSKANVELGGGRG